MLKKKKKRKEQCMLTDREEIFLFFIGKRNASRDYQSAE